MGVIYILSDTDIQGAKKLPLIKQRYFAPKVDLSVYDYLIFTSKNGVKAINHYTDSWKTIPSLAIGKATAKMIEQLGGKVVFVAKSFYGKDFIKEVAKRFKDAKILYLRPKKVATNIAALAKELGLDIKEVIVYETLCQECDKLKPPPKGSTIIFSSPSTIECFFHCFEWDSSYKAVVIGKKSASAMPKNISYELFEQMSLQEIVDSLQKRV